MKVYQRGETIVLRLEVRNSAGTLVDPSDDVLVTVYAPDGDPESPLVNEDDMLNISTGVYTYDLPTIPVNDVPATLGWYSVRFSAEDSGRITLVDYGFQLDP